MNVTKLFDYSIPLVSAATVLGGALIAVGLIGGYTAYQIKVANDSINVTGSAKETIEADTARWIIAISTTTGVNDEQTGYARLEGATKQIVGYLKAQGFTDFETPSITSSPNYSYPQYSAPVLVGFSIDRQIIVRSKDIEKIETLASDIAPFTGQNYNVTTQTLELTFGELAAMRVKLLSEAIKDARARAVAIAQDSGRSVGALRAASTGVVQVLPAGGMEVSDYGTYDTQSRKKDIMVVVRATFGLR